MQKTYTKKTITHYMYLAVNYYYYCNYSFGTDYKYLYSCDAAKHILISLRVQLTFRCWCRFHAKEAL